MKYPILYSFRRCPYAMRARLAIKICDLQVELREITLRNKPPSMLALSPKGTVPVLQLHEGPVVDESWDIIQWASCLNDPQNLRGNNDQRLSTSNLINRNDNIFKKHLDHYKYADRFPEHPASYYRSQAEEFLQELEALLSRNTYLLGQGMTLADIGIFPFIRQFAHVDIDWFREAPYPQLINWMDTFIESSTFKHIMYKHTPWTIDNTPVYV